MEPEAPSATPSPAGAAPPSPMLGKREGRSPRDMALSLLVLLVPIVLVVAFYRVVLNGDAPVTVDPGPAIQEARSAAVFPVAVPTGLGKDWHVSNATFQRATDGATLRLGYVAPDDDALLLVQSSIPPATLLPTELGKTPEPRGNFRDGQRAWRQYEARQGETALVLTEPGRTIVVVGNTDPEHLQALASSLS